MASPNYQGEKRRKDLAKQAKKKEKLARKLDKSRGVSSSSDDETTEAAGEEPKAPEAQV